MLSACIRDFRRILSAAVAALVCTAALADLEADKTKLETLPSLASVSWAGPAPDLAFLDGKTVVVLTYVTWCPKCNAWMDELAAELKKQVADKPVAVLAISTDTPPPEAIRYMQEMKFLGPNIFHGSDPTIATRFGFTNQFMNFAIVGPDGTIVMSGNAGRRYEGEQQPVFYPARLLGTIENLGSFRFVNAEMPETLKERLWLLETGVTRDAKKLEAGLEPKDQELMRSSVSSFLANEIETIEKLSVSDTTTDRLAAMHRATFLSTNFGGSTEGRRAKDVLGSIAKDKAIKDELSAKKQYDAAMKVAEPARRSKGMAALAKKLPDTVYGKKAAKAAEQP